LSIGMQPQGSELPCAGRKSPTAAGACPKRVVHLILVVESDLAFLPVLLTAQLAINST
jgi:hypothetical protein